MRDQRSVIGRIITVLLGVVICIVICFIYFAPSAYLRTQHHELLKPDSLSGSFVRKH